MIVSTIFMPLYYLLFYALNIFMFAIGYFGWDVLFVGLALIVGTVLWVKWAQS